MPTNDFDYSDHIEKPSDEAFAELNALVEEQTAAAAQVAAAENLLKAATARYRDVSEKKLPELMERLDLETFTTSTGMKIEVKESVRASISEETARRAYTWLEEQGEGGIIKNTVKIEFSRNEDARANEFVKELLGRGNFDVQNKKSVNFQTLCKFVRDRLAAGQDVPEDIFNVFRQRVAKVTA